ncbi:MAG: hypothetical protein JWN52_3578 [Actinomycetia bacterium]|nr:hypothetical protein [Actinomycetes bacterium]
MTETRYGRYRLVGDEDCGVGIECRDHFDGGRPLAYYSGDASAYADDPEVENVTTISGLLAAAERHEAEVHAGAVAVDMTVKADPSMIVHIFSRPMEPAIQVTVAEHLRQAQMKHQYGAMRYR